MTNALVPTSTGDPCIITYDLHRPEQNYPALIQAIQRLKGAFRYQQSSWIVQWIGHPKTLRNALTGLIDKDDSLMVVRAEDAAWQDMKITLWMLHHGYQVEIAA